MKSIITLLGFFMFLSQFVVAQDTLFIGNDTSVCTNNGFEIIGNLPDSIYDYVWNTGDTISSISIDTSGMYFTSATRILIDTFQDINMMDSFAMDTIMQFDTITVEIKPAPIPDFSVDPVCFGDSSIIINASQFTKDSTVVYDINGHDMISDTSDEITVFINENNVLKKVIASIHQTNGCHVIDSFFIEVKQQPVASFNYDPTCNNENLILINQSTAVSSGAMNTAILNGSSNGSSSNTDNINLGIKAADTFQYEIVVDNQNGCTDTASLMVEIFAVTEVSFSGLNLDLEYCRFDPASILTGSENGGTFNGLYVTDFGNGSASFNPATADTNIAVLYSFTNSFGCTDVEAQTVAFVHPLPTVFFSGLDPEYCQFDSSSLITGNQVGGEFNNILIPTPISSTTYDFNPDSVGTFDLIYSYTDLNGCYKDTSQTTIVHPLPLIDLPSQVNLGVGQTVILGDPNPDPNIEFEWSNGKMTSTIEVGLPGIYVVTAINTITTCMASDTIIVKLSTSIRDISSVFKLYPNPIIDILTIEFDAPYNGSIMIYDMVGKSVFSSDIDNPITKYSIRTHFPSGLYFLNLEGVGSVVINKL